MFLMSLPQMVLEKFMMKCTRGTVVQSGNQK